MGKDVPASGHVLGAGKWKIPRGLGLDVGAATGSLLGGDLAPPAGVGCVTG